MNFVLQLDGLNPKVLLDQLVTPSTHISHSIANKT